MTVKWGMFLTVISEETMTVNKMAQKIIPTRGDIKDERKMGRDN